MSWNIRIIEREYIKGIFVYDVWVGDMPRAWTVTAAELPATVQRLVTHTAG